jgi:hypothetical protein
MARCALRAEEPDRNGSRLAAFVAALRICNEKLRALLLKPVQWRRLTPLIYFSIAYSGLVCDWLLPVFVRSPPPQTIEFVWRRVFLRDESAPHRPNSAEAFGTCRVLESLL